MTLRTVMYLLYFPVTFVLVSSILCQPVSPQLHHLHPLPCIVHREESIPCTIPIWVLDRVKRPCLGLCRGVFPDFRVAKGTAQRGEEWETEVIGMPYACFVAGA